MCQPQRQYRAVNFCACSDVLEQGAVKRHWAAGRPALAGGLPLDIRSPAWFRLMDWQEFQRFQSLGQCLNR